MFTPTLDVKITGTPLGLEFISPTLCAQETEYRALDSIRSSLLDVNCSGPDPVYAINMDVCQKGDLPDLIEKDQLYGVVAYASGLLGKEAVRSQGHRHGISISSNSRTGEAYQIWQGSAYICMQRPREDGTLDFWAVKAEAGDIVLVHPDWIHATVNADPSQTLVFGAWCVRDYTFEYEEVRSKRGMAFYPTFDSSHRIEWLPNPRYKKAVLHQKFPETYAPFGLKQQRCIYRQYKETPALFEFITKPLKHLKKWENFIP